MAWFAPSCAAQGWRSRRGTTTFPSRRPGVHRQLAPARCEGQRGAIQRQIEATDAEIDRVVYELYGLTEDEIAIIEGARCAQKG